MRTFFFIPAPGRSSRVVEGCSSHPPGRGPSPRDSSPSRPCPVCFHGIFVFSRQKAENEKKQKHVQVSTIHFSPGHGRAVRVGQITRHLKRKNKTKHTKDIFGLCCSRPHNGQPATPSELARTRRHRKPTPPQKKSTLGKTILSVICCSRYCTERADKLTRELANDGDIAKKRLLPFPWASQPNEQPHQNCQPQRQLNVFSLRYHFFKYNFNKPG